MSTLDAPRDAVLKETELSTVPATARWARWKRGPSFTLPGSWVALVFVCLSFTPSLLPRDGLVQGLLCGINGAIGYGIGVVGAWVWRAFADRDVRVASRRSWRVFLITAALALAGSTALGLWWQEQIRDLFGIADNGVWQYVALPFVFALVFLVIISVGRLLRRTYRWISRQLRRWIGARAAAAVGWVAVAFTAFFMVTGVLSDALVTAADRSFALTDLTTPSGVEQPLTPLRSGSPSSLVPWDSLGRQGRAFVSRGPTMEMISDYQGSTAMVPIRIFSGFGSADSSEERAELAVRDLVRAGGFDRERLLVVSTTGSGFVEPSAVDSFEYLSGGDSATVAMQYSHLPSWISYLVDQEHARAAGRDLFDAVYAQWLRRAPDDRPELFVFGESLGSFGGETAFSGAHDLANRTSGALFVGPPNFNTLYREFTDDRRSDSLEIEPVYREGRIVRFSDGDALPAPDAPWPGTRVLYLLYPSDPIVWWSPDLAFNKPDWLREQRGDDILGEMMWIPIITFWQVSADLPFSLDVPAGHGHKYTGFHGDAWATVLRVPEWTAAEADRLRSFVAQSR